jgi:hypothetical protein
MEYPALMGSRCWVLIQVYMRYMPSIKEAQLQQIKEAQLHSGMVAFPDYMIAFYEYMESWGQKNKVATTLELPDEATNLETTV